MIDVQIDPSAFKNYRDNFDFMILPKGAALRYEQSSPQEKDAWFLMRYKCAKSHLYLSGFIKETKADDPDLPANYLPILGMDFLAHPHGLLFSKFLQKRPGAGLALSELDPLVKKRMILWPRGHFKTTATRVEMVQTILNYPDVRICFLTGSNDLAKRQLAALKQVFEKPSKMSAYLFPEFCYISVLDKKKSKKTEVWVDVQPSMGTTQEFTVPCRRNMTFAEPTFAISTARSVQSGAHFDVIFIDDLVNNLNYRSVKALEKCYQEYLDICPLLEPSGYIVMTGTRYSWGDTYEKIQESAKEENRKTGRSVWNFSIRDCWSHGCKNCSHTDAYHDSDVNILQPPCTVSGCNCIGFVDNGSKGVLFPYTHTHDKREMGFTLESLEQKKLESGPEFFANQYENRPISVESQTFDEMLIGRQTFHHANQFPTYAQGVTFGVGDLAYVGQDGRDYSVIFMCRMYQGRIYIFDCDFGYWDAGQVAEHTVNALLRHRPKVMYYEQTNGWDGFDRLIRALATAKGLPNVPLQWQKCSRTANAKTQRIGAIKGWLSSGRLWFYAGMPGYDQLLRQLVRWPKLGKHDDFADCAGQVVEAPTGVHLEAPIQTDTAKNWLRELNQTTKTEEPDTRPAGSYGDDEKDGWR